MKRYLWIVMLVALVCCAFMIGSSRAANTQQWEYKIEYKMTEKKANELGSQGWELVAISSGGGASSMVDGYAFKRPKN